MSLVVLKRKTNAKRNISGRSNNNSTMGTHGPYSKNKGGGGFSLNGPTINTGGVGRNSLFSPVRNSLVQIPTENGMVSVQRGWGGYYGTYNRGTLGAAPKQFLDGCESDVCVKISRPSVLSTKGMLSYRNKWKKTNVPGLGDYPGQIQEIYNNWVKPGTSNGSNMLKTSGQHTIEKSINYAGCYPYNVDIDAGNKQSTVAGSKCGHHIGGKYIPETPYTKSKHQPSNNALNNYIVARGGLNPYGWQKGFPYTYNSGGCSSLAVKQASDPLLRGNYYPTADTLPRPCRKVNNCYNKIPGTPEIGGCIPNP
jgi:hypothetical protein